ncbi:MAG: hypothetical protein V1873_03160 [Verrucomicrobiota bacterium]
MSRQRAAFPLMVLSLVASLCFFGCDGNDDGDDDGDQDAAATNAPADGEVTLDSKNFQVSDGDVSATGTKEAPGEGTITGTARWNEGGTMHGVLVKNGADAAVQSADDTPLVMSSHTEAGDEWKFEVSNATGKDQDLHMYLTFKPD